MGRINGVNSDYKFKNGAIEEVKPLPNPLEMKIFICPNNQKNSVEAESGICNGINSTCPSNLNTTGHAMLHLHQQSGLQLVTDNNNKLQLDQNGNILMQPGTVGKVEIRGNVETRGNVEMKNAAGNATHMAIRSNTMVITVAGAKVEIKTDGSIELTPAGGKAVKINGNLTVTGTVNGKTI